MKNMLALVGAVVVLVGGLGWYLGWFKFGAEQGTPGHPKFNVEVESDKIKADLKKGKETVGEFIKDHENGKGVPGTTTSNSPHPLPGVGFEVPSQLLPKLPDVPQSVPFPEGGIPPLPPPPLPPPLVPTKN